LGGDRGKFTINFTPTVPGWHWVDFVFKGTWANDPFKLPISDGPNCPEVQYEGKYRSGNAPLPLQSSTSVPASPVTPAAPPVNEEEEKQKREEDRLRKEDERLRKEEEEKTKREEDERLRKEEERLKKEEQERLRREEEEKVKREKYEALKESLEGLSNADLATEIAQTIQKLQILTLIQQSRIPH